MAMLPHLLTLALLVPADWPHLRGPAYDGVSTETGLAQSWPVEGPPQLWTRDLAQGHSGFIVAHGRLYTQRQTLTSQYLLCLDPATGETVWETRYDWSWQPRGAYPGPYATPTAYQGKIYATSPAGYVVCVNAHTGTRHWTVNVREKFDGDGFGFGYAIAPTVEDGRVILPVGGPNASLVALDADTGKTLWATGSDPASYCPALPITFAGRRCVVGYLQNAWVIVEAATGKQLHRQVLSSGYDEHSAWPLYREPHLLLAAPFRAPAVRHRLETSPDRPLHAMPQWSRKDFANDVASSVLYRDHVYGFDVRQAQSSQHRATRGEFRCLDWESGKTAWSTDRVGQAGVLVAEDKLFLLNDTGTLILADADPMAYRERGRVQLFEDEICWTPPTLVEGRLFVRSPSRAVCLWVGRRDDLAPETPTITALPTGSWHIPSAWLLSREREFPNDAPTGEEMAVWFLASLALLGLAVGVALPFCSRSVIFLTLAFVFPLLGPNVLSVAFGRLLFTWPASLYVGFHATLAICQGAIQNRTPWRARLAIAAFLLVCYAYFEACRTVGMFIAWAFLVGFPLAFPLTWFAVWAARERRWFCAVVGTLLAFGVFFASGWELLVWKASQTTH